MSTYKIVSPRIGEPGASFDVEAAVKAGVNVEALIESGLIAKASAPKTPKAANVGEEPKE